MGILDLGRYKGIVFAITGFLVFIAIILAVNHGKAGQFSDDVSAVKFLAEQREQPGAVYAAGIELAARLKSGEKIDDSLEAMRKATGVAGRLMKKRDEPNLWMEVYENVTDEARFEWELAEAVDHLKIQELLLPGTPRHLECFQEP